MTALIALSTIAFVGVADPDVDDIVQPKFQDVQYTTKVIKPNFAELSKIDDDFGKQYRFDEMQVALKEPYKLRLETKINEATVQLIQNKYKVTYRIPRNNFTNTQDLEKSIGRLQTIMEYGIVTPSVVKDIFDAKYVRTDRATGDYVFDLTYKARFDNTSRHRIWVDPDKRYVTKREWWGQGSRPRMKAIFIYEEPVNSGGVWVPSKATVRNVDNKVAATTMSTNVKINQGISDSLFGK
ncbi:MAG: outer membrane lipoprotein-sorting protein [Fimbriimonadaceae bacterium]|nr:outer membrane lipoprotein-sorting protein [Fimbriimonadaceae bacterium]